MIGRRIAGCLCTGRMLGDKCSVADYPESLLIADDLVAESDKRAGVPSAHHAAARPNYVSRPWRWPTRDLSSERREWCSALRCAILERGGSGYLPAESATRASAELSYWPSSAPPLFHVFSRTATANTLPVSASWEADPGSSTSWTALETMCCSAAVRFPEINGVSAIVAEILRRSPEAASAVAVLARMQLPLHYACESASLQACRSWSSCCKRILLASPSVIASTAPLEVAVQFAMWLSCSACWQRARRRQ
jgi:hypothetical protein